MAYDRNSLCGRTGNLIWVAGNSFFVRIVSGKSCCRGAPGRSSKRRPAIRRLRLARRKPSSPTDMSYGEPALQVELSFERSEIYECGAALLSVLACPKPSDEAKRSQLLVSLCGKAIWL